MAGCRSHAGHLGDRELKLAVLAVGRCRDRRINHLCEDYLDRISRHVNAGIVEVEARSDRALVDRLRRSLSPGTFVVALDAAGEALDSPGFASRLETLLSRNRRVAFVVGDAAGLPAGVDGLVHERLSLSPMTLPHRLARLLLLEQIYRAFTILRGEPYHR